jgi:hypothetical protein
MRITSKLGVSAALLAILAAAPAGASAGERLVGSTGDDRVVTFSSDEPDDARTVRLDGLAPGERIQGLDVRPATGQLYALGSSSRIYTVALERFRATATPVGTAAFSPLARGRAFGFDFNPTVDRIRVVSQANQNLRLDPNSGAVAGVDTDLAYGEGDAGFGDDPIASGAAYTNNDNDPATGTTLYDIDAERDALVTQNPPNAGTLVTVGSLGMRITDAVGFDIAASDGTAYAALQRDCATSSRRFAYRRASRFCDGRSQLFRVDLASGRTRWLGEIDGRFGGRKPLTSLATLGSADAA